jgi:GntR family transcriptional regulator
MAHRMNLPFTVGGLQIDLFGADKESANGLDVAEGTRLTRVQRVMRADDRPAAYLVDILPETYLNTSDLPDDFSGSVLDFLLARGDGLTLSRATVSATNATPEVAKALEIQRGDVLLYFNSQLYDANNHVVDYSVSYFIPGYFRFHINRRVGNS